MDAFTSTSRLRKRPTHARIHPIVGDKFYYKVGPLESFFGEHGIQSFHFSSLIHGKLEKPEGGTAKANNRMSSKLSRSQMRAGLRVER